MPSSAIEPSSRSGPAGLVIRTPTPATVKAGEISRSSTPVPLTTKIDRPGRTSSSIQDASARRTTVTSEVGKAKSPTGVTLSPICRCPPPMSSLASEIVTAPSMVTPSGRTGFAPWPGSVAQFHRRTWSRCSSRSGCSKSAKRVVSTWRPPPVKTTPWSMPVARSVTTVPSWSVSTLAARSRAIPRTRGATASGVGSTPVSAPATRVTAATATPASPKRTSTDSAPAASRPTPMPTRGVKPVPVKPARTTAIGRSTTGPAGMANGPARRATRTPWGERVSPSRATWPMRVSSRSRSVTSPPIVSDGVVESRSRWIGVTVPKVIRRTPPATGATRTTAPVGSSASARAWSPALTTPARWASR